MFRKIANTFGTRLLAAICNFLIAIVISQSVGDVGKGEQSLLLATITFILIFSDIVSGNSLVFLTPKHAFHKLVFPAALWSSVVGLFAIGFMLLFYGDLSPILALHTGLLAVLASLRAIPVEVLIGREKVRQANLLNLLQPVLILLTLLVGYFVMENYSIFSYIVALYVSYGLTWLLGLWMLRDEFRGFRIEPLAAYRQVVADLFKYGLLNQLGHFVQFFNLRMGYYLLDMYMDKGRVGIFSNAVSLSEAIWIISNSIALVQYARIANAQNERYSQKLTLSLAKLCFVVSLLAVLFLSVLPSSFYQLLFGPEFGELPGVIRILAPGVLMYSLFLIIGHYYSGIGKYQMNTYAALCGLFFTVTMGFLLIPRFDIYGAAATSTLAYSANAVFILICFLKSSQFGWRDMIVSREELRSYYIEFKDYIRNFFKDNSDTDKSSMP